MKKDIKKQLITLKKEELKEVKGGRQYVPADFYVPTAPSFGIWEDADIRFGGGLGKTKNLFKSNTRLSSVI